MKKLFYLLPFTIFCSFIAKAQTIDTSFIYDFSGNADTLQSEITAVYAEEDIILVAGHVQRTGEPKRFYTAAFDYNGQLLWHKEPHLPAEWAHNELAEYSNLKKIAGSNHYVIGGSIHNTTIQPGYDMLQPFIYIFNKNGDSIKFERVSSHSDGSIRLTALDIDDDKNILVSGSVSISFITDTITGLQIMDSSHVWLLKHKENTVWEQIIPKNTFYVFVTKHAVPNGFLYDKIYNKYIIPVSLHYKDPFEVHILLYIDVQTGVLLDYKQTNAHEALDVENRDIGLWGYPYGQREMAMIRRKNNQGFALTYSVYRVPFPHDYMRGLFWEVWNQSGQATKIDTFFIHRTSGSSFMVDTYLLDNGKIRLAEAYNRELFILKRGTSGMMPTQDKEGRHIPFLMRTDKNGNKLWHTFFSHIQIKDSNISHVTNSISISPNNKIVMGGYVQAKDKVSGVYDTVGSVSWLIIMSDSLRDTVIYQNVQTIEKQNEAFSIYPNPSVDKITLDINKNDYASNYVALVYNLMGQKIMEIKCNVSPIEINIGSLSEGTYFIQLMQNGKEVGNKKFWKME